MTSSLWMNDPNPEARQAGVAQSRAWYRWDRELLAPLPMLEIPNTGSKPGILEFLKGSAKDLPPPERPFDDMPEARALASAEGLAALGLERLNPFAHRLKKPQDYFRLSADVPLPHNLADAGSLESNWSEDAVFAWERLAGPNPVMIQGLDAAAWAALQARLQAPSDLLQRAWGPGAPTIDAALAAGDLFVCDYGLLADPEPVMVQPGRRLPVATGLFGVWGGRLLPVAIQPDRALPLQVRDGSGTWSCAKGLLGVSDFNLHEMGTHLSLTHFVQEGLAVAAFRSLPAAHPVCALLREVFCYLIYNNFAGRELLIQPGGFVEQILAGDLSAGSMEIVKRAYAHFHFDDLDLPRQLAGRRLERLPVYPMRDDGLLLWGAIERFVQGYVEAWYPDDATVRADPDLAAWAQETTSPDGAHLRGFPEAFEGRDALVQVLVRLLFLAGPHHALVNFPQWQSMRAIPNLPGAAWSGANDDLMTILPPFEPAAQQALAMFTLTSYQYGQLGHYPRLTDPQVQAAITRFQGELGAIETELVDRDRTVRSFCPYPYLRPSRVPNSTNI